MSERGLHSLSVHALSVRIHDGSLSPVTLVEHLLDRIEALDSALHAFRLVPRERALAAARAAETALAAGVDLGPLHGIPFAVKDIIDVAGLPTTAGSNLLPDPVATNATVVRDLLRAGMVMIGKTHTVQFALGSIGVNHHHGTPHNPWHREPHSPGGSSSGSAVAVAAGLAPVALGTDTGGSVRIPAALCGTVGLKTTVGQVSRAGVFPLSRTLDSVGPLTRTVRDAALVYQAMLTGPDPADPSTAAFRAHDALERLDAGVEGLRLGVVESPFFDDADPEAASLTRAAAETLSRLGARVDNLDLPSAAASLAANPGGIISRVEARLAHRGILGERFHEYDPVVADRLDLVAGATAFDYLDAVWRCEALVRETVREMQGFDAFLAPTTMHPALPLAEVDASVEVYREAAPRFSRNTSVGNLLGLCGLTVPCGITRAGLPVGLMISGLGGTEPMALRIGHAYEQARDCGEREPNLGWIEPAPRQ